MQTTIHIIMFVSLVILNVIVWPAFAIFAYKEITSLLKEIRDEQKPAVYIQTATTGVSPAKIMHETKKLFDKDKGVYDQDKDQYVG